VLGGLLVQLTWRLIFFVNVPIGLALLVSSWRLLPPDLHRREQETDAPGAILVTAGVALLVFAITRAGDTLRITQPAVLGAISILLGAFVLRERTARFGLVDLALFEDRPILGANLSLMGLGAITAGELLVLTLYLQEGRHLSPVLTGLCFVLQALGGFSLSRPVSKLAPAFGPRRALAVSATLSVVAMVGVAAGVIAGSFPALLVGLFVMGMTNRVTTVAATLAGTHGPLAARAEGTASALLTTSRQSGAALGVAILSAFLVAVHGTEPHRTAVAMFVLASFALATLATTFVIPPRPLPDEPIKPERLFRHHCGGVT
jgi:predicted MFS family arabinose efflux permease